MNNRNMRLALMLMGVGSVILILTAIISIASGAANIAISEVVNAFTNFDAEDSYHLLIRTVRMPRVITAILVGAALSIAGAVMQGLTKNPLADSGLMGLNSGAVLALALCFSIFRGVGYYEILLATFLGALFGAVSVFSISSLIPGGNAQIKLVLSGMAITALLSSLSQGLTIMFKVSQNVNFWTMGAVNGTTWEQLRIAGPVIIAAIVGSFFLSKSLTILNLGDAAATGLGVNVMKIKAVGILLVVLLSGTSVAIAGSIGFVGIIVPHFVRMLVGSDYRLVLPVSSILGGILVVVADIFAKTLAKPTEIPLGALIALVGVPVFLYYARRHKGG
ncbi:FecCD family ABC transporter permease [Fusibacter bizertensis]